MKALLVFALLMASVPVFAGLKVEVSNVQRADGTLCLLVFANEAGFPGDARKAVFKSTAAAEKATDKTFVFEIGELKAGKYAIVVMHDLDGNRQLKTGLFGQPKEPVGLSNWAGKSRPKFAECLVEVAGGETVNIPLR